MKSIYILAGLLFFSVLAGAQGITEKEGRFLNKKGELLNGRVEKMSDEDQTKTVMTYRDGLLHGDFLLYSFGGDLLEKGQYIDGEKDGKWTNWTEEGVKTSEIAYVNGERDGKWQIWDEDGNLRCLMFYSSGDKVGNWKIYAANGELKEEKDYSSNL